MTKLYIHNWLKAKNILSKLFIIYLFAGISINSQSQVTAVHSVSEAVIAVNGSNKMYSINVNTGIATEITSIPSTVGGISTGIGQNGLAINHANGLIYYTSNTASISNVSLFAYDYINKIHILVDNDLTSGSPSNLVVGNSGVASGGATMGHGFLYFGVENNLGGDGSGTVSDDAIYTIQLAANGRSIVNILPLVFNIVSNDWGDIAFDPINNKLISATWNNALNINSAYNYFLNSTGDAVTSTSTYTITCTTCSGAQLGRTQSNKYYTGGTQIIQFDPLSGSTINSPIPITTDGTTPLTVLFDADAYSPATGQIGDKVFRDINGNGIFDGTDTGLANVTLGLYSDANNNGVIEGTDSQIATVTTSSSGNYLFTSVLPGTYIVRVTDQNNVISNTWTYTTPGLAFRADGDITELGLSKLNVDFGLNAQCSAGTNPPSVSQTNVSNSCPASTVNLNSIVVSNTPSGSNLVWFTNNTHSGSSYPNASMAGAGIYYAFYFDSTNNCYSPASTAVTVNIVTCCNAGLVGPPLH